MKHFFTQHHLIQESTKLVRIHIIKYYFYINFSCFSSAMKFGLEEASPDVVSIVSHAVQERLKTLVEKLGMIAEHRQEQLKVCFY